MAEFKIRRGRREDIRKGLLEALSRLSKVGLTPEEAKEICRKRLANPFDRWFVAELEDGRVVGTITLLVEQKFIHRGGKVGHIEDVAVRKEFEGRGIARALVKAAIEEARQEGCYKVILDCNENNAKLYKKWGFRKHEIGMRIDLQS